MALNHTPLNAKSKSFVPGAEMMISGIVRLVPVRQCWVLNNVRPGERNALESALLDVQSLHFRNERGRLDAQQSRGTVGTVDFPMGAFQGSGDNLALANGEFVERKFTFAIPPGFRNSITV